VVDLSEASFLDSSALSALMLCQRELGERAIEFRVVCPENSPARKALEITDLIEPLAVIETLDVALAPAAPPG
jgi:anti-anti-sigma regulatory factor